MDKQEKSFTGYSGCSVKLIHTENDKWIVRKTAKDTTYNNRLKMQMLKQKHFKSRLRGVYAPSIHASYRDGSLFAFDMDLIDGQNMAKYIVTTDIPSVSLLVYKLLDSLEITNHKRADTQSIFLRKISSLQSTQFPYNNNIKTAFKILNGFDWTNVTSGPCHGDLTLENVLMSNEGDIYLIDFLDSFFNSWMMDVAKILQDIELGWAFRFEADNVNRDIRLNLVRKKLIERLLQLPDGQNIVNTVYHVLLLNIIRIYPYTTDAKILEFLNRSLSKTISIIANYKEVYVSSNHPMRRAL